MKRAEKARSLAELAEETQIPKRTIRFYIARGLLPGPDGAGRGATYGNRHIGRLETIRAMQERGLMLAEIARALAGEKSRDELPAPSAWWQYEVAGDVTVSVKAGVAPWRLRQIRNALKEMKVRLTEER